ncbi:hypothetical protein D3C81_2072070 [compost metagenome]
MNISRARSCLNDLLLLRPLFHSLDSLLTLNRGEFELIIPVQQGQSWLRQNQFGILCRHLQIHLAGC